MSKLIVIGDIHTHYGKVERIISKYENTHKFIFMGDYFDQFGDTPEINASTAFWLKTQMIARPDWVYLKGNHDEIYDPRTSCMCSGFSSQKKTAINEVLNIQDWDTLKYFHYENGYWFSHAGLTKHWHVHPMKEGLVIENVQRIIDNAVVQQRAGLDTGNAIWAASLSRGGSHVVGSLLWQDWRDMEMIPNTKQVVGHSPIHRIQAITDNAVNSVIVNVDSSSSLYHQEVLEIDENGNRQILNTSYV